MMLRILPRGTLRATSSSTNRPSKGFDTAGRVAVEHTLKFERAIREMI
jgi:hypothetical protein